MTVIVNKGFLGERGSTTFEVTSPPPPPKKKSTPPTKLQLIINASVILVLKNYFSHLATDSAVLKM